MDKLLNPDVGLMIWTVVTFVCVALVLGRFAWKPILKALEEREEGLRAAARSAEESRQAAERLKDEYDRQLAQVQTKGQELIARTQAEAQPLREEMLRAAQDESARLTEKTRRQLAEEQRRLVQELRTEVVGASVRMAEKILGSSVDKKVQDRFVDEAIKDFEKSAGGSGK